MRPHPRPHYHLCVPCDLLPGEWGQVALLVQAALTRDHGEARWHARWETYTCSLDIVEGGRN